MSAPRLVLLSGMGSGRRLLTTLQVSGVDLVAPDHVDPQPKESLPDYARRVSHLQFIGPSDFIGGASFGGMVAAEIARQQSVAGLVLLGSCVHPENLPWSYRWLEWLSRFVPDIALGLRRWKPLIRWRFAPTTQAADEALVEMARSCPPSQLRAFGRMTLRWRGVEQLSCPVLSIHGDLDRIIPLGCAEEGITLRSAGHAFTLTHAAETSRAIESLISKSRVTAWRHNPCDERPSPAWAAPCYGCR